MGFSMTSGKSPAASATLSLSAPPQPTTICRDHENLVTVGIGAAWGQLEPHRSVFLAVGGREGLQYGTDPRLPPHHHHPFPTTPPNTHQLEGMLNAELQLAVELLGGSWGTRSVASLSTARLEAFLMLSTRAPPLPWTPPLLPPHPYTHQLKKQGTMRILDGVSDS